MCDNPDMVSSLSIPNFSLEKEIGRGGMATVYLAHQLAPKRKAAVKIVAPRRGDDPAFLRTLKREGDTVAQLSHPNIVTVYACGVVDNHYYLAMEMLDGGDLASRIREGVSVASAVAILGQIAGALEHAHAHNILHRDIKPENILFHESGRAVLVDFGIAKESDRETPFTQAGAVVGTPHYMAPERAQGKSVDGRSDLYALGVVFYEMLTGEKMYQGNDTFAISYAHVHEPVPALPESLARYQPLLERLVAKDPDQRFQNATELRSTLRFFGESPTSNDEGGTLVMAHDRESGAADQRPSSSRRRSPVSALVVGALAIAVIATVAAIVLAVRDDDAEPTAEEPLISMQARTRIRDLLQAAEAQTRIGNYTVAEDLYAQVLSDFDCGNREARGGLKSANPTRYHQVVADCR